MSLSAELKSMLLLGPGGARRPEEVGTNPAWLAARDYPMLRDTMVAGRKNLLAFRKGD